MKRTTMFGTALVVVLTGSLATTAAAQEESATIDPCTTDAVRVAGAIIWGDLEHDPIVTESDDSQHIRDFVFLSKIKADDARLEGDTTATIDWDFYALDRKPRNRAGLNHGTFRIDGAAGSWEGPWTGVGIATDSWRALIELTGSGAYDGLAATLFVHSGESGPISGVIHPTNLAACDFAAAG